MQRLRVKLEGLKRSRGSKKATDSMECEHTLSHAGFEKTITNKAKKISELSEDDG